MTNSGYKKQDEESCSSDEEDTIDKLAKQRSDNYDPSKEEVKVMKYLETAGEEVFDAS